MSSLGRNFFRAFLGLASLALSAPGLTASLHSHAEHSAEIPAGELCHAHARGGDHHAPTGDVPLQSQDEHCQTCYQIAQAGQGVAPPPAICIEQAIEPAGEMQAVALIPPIRSHTPFSSPRAPPSA